MCPVARFPGHELSVVALKGSPIRLGSVGVNEYNEKVSARSAPWPNRAKCRD